MYVTSHLIKYYAIWLQIGGHSKQMHYIPTLCEQCCLQFWAGKWSLPSNEGVINTMLLWLACRHRKNEVILYVRHTPWSFYWTYGPSTGPTVLLLDLTFHCLSISLSKGVNLISLSKRAAAWFTDDLIQTL
jgi:hypothetical protein